MNKIIDAVKKREGGQNNLVSRAYDSAKKAKISRTTQLNPTGNPHIDSLVEVLVDTLIEIETLRNRISTLQEQLDSHEDEPHFGDTEFNPYDKVLK